LRIHDIISTLRNYRRKLKNWNNPDVALILYYFGSATRNFVQGDFESCYMDGYKIVFDKAFDKIHKISNLETRRLSFKEFRVALAHAKAMEDVEEVEHLSGKVEKIQGIKKRLFAKSIEMLKIIKFEFLDMLDPNAIES
jgi:hypothetical protein